MIFTTRPQRAYFLASADTDIITWLNSSRYNEKPVKAGEFYINLPFPGNYNFTGDKFEFVRVEDFTPSIPANFPPLPAPDRKKIFGIHEIKVDNKSNSPARIYTDKGIITLNPRFFYYPGEIKLFILLHELGHFYYTEEWKCDMYAAYHYLQMGCNRSNAFDALAGVIHTEKKDGTPHIINRDRILKIYNLLK
jgi:hypothetical protein